MSQANLCDTVPRLSLRSDSIYQYNQPAHEFRGRAVFGYGNVVYVRLNLPNSLSRHGSASFDKLSKRKPPFGFGLWIIAFFTSQCRFLSSTTSCSYTSPKRVELAYEAPLSPTRRMQPRHFPMLCFGGLELTSITILETTVVFNFEYTNESKRVLDVCHQTYSTQCLSFASFAILGTCSFPTTATSNPTRNTNVIVALRA